MLKCNLHVSSQGSCFHRAHRAGTFQKQKELFRIIFSTRKLGSFPKPPFLYTFFFCFLLFYRFYIYLHVYALFGPPPSCKLYASSTEPEAAKISCCAQAEHIMVLHANGLRNQGSASLGLERICFLVSSLKLCKDGYT
jgi:hypothetical protein